MKGGGREAEDALEGRLVELALPGKALASRMRELMFNSWCE